jgi:hypothetical protein
MKNGNAWGHRTPLEIQKELVMINCISERTLEDLKEKVIHNFGSENGQNCSSQEPKLWVTFSGSEAKKISGFLPDTLEWQDEKKQPDQRRLL